MKHLAYLLVFFAFVGCDSKPSNSEMEFIKTRRYVAGEIVSILEKHHSPPQNREELVKMFKLFRTDESREMAQRMLDSGRIKILRDEVDCLLLDCPGYDNHKKIVLIIGDSGVVKTYYVSKYTQSK